MQITLDPLPTIVFAVVILCWMTFAAVFIFRKKPAATAAVERKRERASILGIVIQGLSYSLVWGVRRPYFSPIVRMSRPLEIALAVLTITLAVGSVWFVMAAVRTLGRQWSFAARVVEGHKLVTEGPYRIVRNPIYTGMLGMLIATGLAMSHWAGLLLGVIVFLAGTLIRVHSEEKLLREEFGQEFEDYSSRVPAIIPGIY
ncbi:MAG TPA: isoprenylcysteine carboxylmethyltransferase family protein [Pyrinomonadaceae bacterium]|jgi:protein-S-isoprenylcysteine O-methyltransferase Ste14